jgi:hypothetical protein
MEDSDHCVQTQAAMLDVSAERRAVVDEQLQKQMEIDAEIEDDWEALLDAHLEVTPQAAPPPMLSWFVAACHHRCRVGYAAPSRGILLGA